MAVRGKFYVAEVTHYHGEQRKVVLRAVSRGAVNRSFAKASPSGEITIMIDNPAASDQFVENIGKEFYVDFTLYHPLPGDGHAFVLNDAPEHYNNGKCVECGGSEDAH